jgi:flavin-dependent dehydrogenase
MIAEISAVVGVLKTLNAGIKTVKESGSHLSDLAGIFTSLTESKVAVETIEEASKQGDHVLTQEEALELAWAKNAIREREKELKKITPRDVWRDMLNIQHKSLMEHKHKLEKERLAKLRKQTKVSEAVKTILGTALLITVGIALYIFINGGQ